MFTIKNATLELVKLSNQEQAAMDFIFKEQDNLDTYMTDLESRFLQYGGIL